MPGELIPYQTPQALAEARGGRLLASALDIRKRFLRWLATSRSVNDLLGRHRRADLFATFFRKRRKYLKVANVFCELVLRVERRLGEYLAEAINHAGGGDRRSPLSAKTAVRDLPPGISRYDSMQFQAVARVSAAAFKLYLRVTQDAGRQITRKGLLSFAGVQRCERRSRQKRPCACSKLVRLSCGCQEAFAKVNFSARCGRCGNRFVCQP